MAQLASYFNADVHWDEDGDTGAALFLTIQGEQYSVCIFLKNGTIYLRMPSNVNFPPGRLPPEFVQFLAERNQTLPYFDWDAIDNSRRCYFVVKSQGRMDRLSAGTLKDVIEKMLPEVVALDTTLRNRGYGR